MQLPAAAAGSDRDSSAVRWHRLTVEVRKFARSSIGVSFGRRARKSVQRQLPCLAPKETAFWRLQRRPNIAVSEQDQADARWRRQRVAVAFAARRDGAFRTFIASAHAEAIHSFLKTARWIACRQAKWGVLR